jgi:hypothetical protein
LPVSYNHTFNTLLGIRNLTNLIETLIATSYASPRRRSANQVHAQEGR